MVHQRFGVKHLDELTLEQVNEAIEYMHRILLDIEKHKAESLKTALTPELYALVYQICCGAIENNYDSMKLVHSLRGFSDESYKWYAKKLNIHNNHVTTLAHILDLKNECGRTLYANGRLNYWGGGALIMGGL